MKEYFTVEEVIELLKQLPPDTELGCIDNGGYCTGIIEKNGNTYIKFG